MIFKWIAIYLIYLSSGAFAHSTYQDKVGEYLGIKLDFEHALRDSGFDRVDHPIHLAKANLYDLENLKLRISKNLIPTETNADSILQFIKFDPYTGTISALLNINGQTIQFRGGVYLMNNPFIRSQNKARNGSGSYDGIVIKIENSETRPGHSAGLVNTSVQIYIHLSDLQKLTSGYNSSSLIFAGQNVDGSIGTGMARAYLMGLGASD